MYICTYTRILDIERERGERHVSTIRRFFRDNLYSRKESDYVNFDPRYETSSLLSRKNKPNGVYTYTHTYTHYSTCIYIYI